MVYVKDLRPYTFFEVCLPTIIFTKFEDCTPFNPFANSRRPVKWPIDIPFEIFLELPILSKVCLTNQFKFYF